MCFTLLGIDRYPVVKVLGGLEGQRSVPPVLVADEKAKVLEVRRIKSEVVDPLLADPCGLLVLLGPLLL